MRHLHPRPTSIVAPRLPNVKTLAALICPDQTWQKYFCWGVDPRGTRASCSSSVPQLSLCGACKGGSEFIATAFCQDDRAPPSPAVVVLRGLNGFVLMSGRWGDRSDTALKAPAFFILSRLWAARRGPLGHGNPR